MQPPAHTDRAGTKCSRWLTGNRGKAPVSSGLGLDRQEEPGAHLRHMGVLSQASSIRAPVRAQCGSRSTGALQVAQVPEELRQAPQHLCLKSSLDTH